MWSPGYQKEQRGCTGEGVQPERQEAHCHVRLLLVEGLNDGDEADGTAEDGDDRGGEFVALMKETGAVESLVEIAPVELEEY